MSKNKQPQRKKSDNNNKTNNKLRNQNISKARRTSTRYTTTLQQKKMFNEAEREGWIKLMNLKNGNQVKLTLNARRTLTSYTGDFKSSYNEYMVDALVVTSIHEVTREVKEYDTNTNSDIIINVPHKVITVKLTQEIKVPIVGDNKYNGSFEANEYKVFPKDQEIELVVGERKWCITCYKGRSCGKCNNSLPFEPIYVQSNVHFYIRGGICFKKSNNHYYFNLIL